MKNTLTGAFALFLAGAANAATTARSWERAIDLGFSYASGNTETTLVTAGFTVDGEVDRDIYAASAHYSYGEDDGNTSSDSLLASASWKRLLSDRAYAGLRADGRYDSLADIDYRISLSGLVGYFLIKSEDTSLSVEGGPGYTLEKTDGEEDDFVNLYAGEQFDHRLFEATTLYQKLSVFSSADNLDDYQILAELGIETELSEKLSLKIHLENKYEAEPAPGREENDFRVVTGISYKF